MLDVGTFDGFYAFLAEHRGAERVLAVDNEQYVAWVRARWGVELAGARASARSAELLGSQVEYRRRGRARARPAPASASTSSTAVGSSTGSRNPLGLLRAVGRGGGAGRAPAGRRYGVIASDGRLDARTIEVQQPGGVYAGDEYVYWGFTAAGIEKLRRTSGFRRFELVDAPLIDSHPRIIGWLRR